MACAAEHAQFNFFAFAAVCATAQRREGRTVDGTPVVMGAAAACLPSLPDWLEPALHPNHRKFFHSATVFVGLSFAMHRLYKWETQDDWEKLARAVGLVAGAAYLAHLARDAFTAKSLPIL